MNGVEKRGGNKVNVVQGGIFQEEEEKGGRKEGRKEGAISYVHTQGLLCGKEGGGKGPGGVACGERGQRDIKFERGTSAARWHPETVSCSLGSDGKHM